jgi:hypothetical protein
VISRRRRGRRRAHERAGTRSRERAEARVAAQCVDGREGAAAGKGDSAPCAHAPAPAGYKAAAPAPPDKVASCDVTGELSAWVLESAKPAAGEGHEPGPEELSTRRRVTRGLGAASRAHKG